MDAAHVGHTSVCHVIQTVQKPTLRHDHYKKMQSEKMRWLSISIIFYVYNKSFLYPFPKGFQGRCGTIGSISHFWTVCYEQVSKLFSNRLHNFLFIMQLLVSQQLTDAYSRRFLIPHSALVFGNKAVHMSKVHKLSYYWNHKSEQLKLYIHSV